MFQSPLVRTLQLLNREEFEALHFFVASPIFNDVRPDETFQLFEYLRRHYPDFESEALNRELAARHFFPNSTNQIGALQRTMAQLMGIVKKFITFRYAVVRDAYEKGEAASLYEIQQKLSLMRFYSERLYQKPVAAKSKVLHDKEIKNRKGRKAENFFQNLNNQVRDELNTQKQFRDFDEYEFIDFQYFKFLVEQEKYLFEGTSSLREGDKNLLAATEQLDTFYLLLKLDHICQLLHYQRMSPLFEPDSAEHARFTANVYHSTQIVRLLREYGFLQQPEIAIYCIFLEFLTQDDPSEADRLSDEFEQLLEKNIQVLPKARVDSLQVILRSYWPARYRETKDKRYLEKIHDRQIRQIAQIQPEDLVPTMFFQNTLFSAFKLGKLEWANDFITQYSGRLKGLDEEQTSLLMEIVSAAAAFYQKDFKKSEKTLPHYLTYGATEDIYLYAIAATLDTRIHYELNDLADDYGHAMMHATTTRIRRDESLHPHRKEERLRFFSVTKELFKLKELRAADRKANLAPGLKRVRARLDSETMVDWEWLEEKWKELEKI